MIAKNLVGVAVVCALSAGCFTARMELPGTLRDDVKPAELENLGTVTVEKKHWFLVEGLFGVPPRDLFTKELRAEVQKRGGDGVANITYESEHTCGDAALGTCTLGCFVPRTYRLSGTVVRVRAPRLPGRPAKLVEAPAAGPVVAQRY